MLQQKCGWRIRKMESVDSTNREAERLVRTLGGKEAHCVAVIADMQTEGRGRYERNWFSPPKLGLWCSAILVPEVSMEDLSQVTLVAAVAVAQAVQELTGVQLGIKWPNDLLYEGRKVCGILTETVPLPQGDMEDDAGRQPVVVGIGLNVHQKTCDFPPELREDATSLALAARLHGARPVSRESVFTGILEKLHTWYELWKAEGFAPIRESWIAQSCTMNRLLSWEEGGKRMEGTAVDLEPDGSLRVCMQDGAIHRLNAGEIRFLRPA